MTRIKTFAAVALTSLTVATAFAPTAEARYYRGGAVAAGIVGGVIAGALIAGAARPAYAAPAPVYEECFRRHVGYDVYGRPVFRTVCY